ncbi:MAG: MFS transporter, partial [Anaerolineales bacterium]|nr:MFS transporter [Anaerolineales bacterium]
FPIFARRRLFSGVSLEMAQRNIGLILTLFGLTNVIMQSFFVGPLVRRFGEQRLIVYATFGRIIAFLGAALTLNAYIFAAFAAPLAIGNALSQPSLQSIISRFSPPKMRGRVLGLFQSTNSLTLVFGPILAGLLLSADFPSLSPETTAALPLFAAAGLVTVAFFMSFKILRLELPTQEAALEKT